LIYLASRSGLPIVPVGVAYTRGWRLRSWDRFGIPHPWSIATCVFAPAVHVPSDLNREGLQHYRRLIQEEMEAVTGVAERWAATGVMYLPQRTQTRKAG